MLSCALSARHTNSDAVFGQSTVTFVNVSSTSSPCSGLRSWWTNPPQLFGLLTDIINSDEFTVLLLLMFRSLKPPAVNGTCPYLRYISSLEIASVENVIPKID
jgi:hypothetical protein